MRKNKIVDDLITKYGVETLKEIFTDFGDCESLEYFKETTEEYNEWARQYIEDRDEVLMKAYPVVPQDEIEYLYEIGELVFYRLVVEVRGYEQFVKPNYELMEYEQDYRNNYFKKNNIKIS